MEGAVANEAFKLFVEGVCLTVIALIFLEWILWKLARKS